MITERLKFTGGITYCHSTSVIWHFLLLYTSLISERENEREKTLKFKFSFSRLLLPSSTLTLWLTGLIVWTSLDWTKLTFFQLGLRTTKTYFLAWRLAGIDGETTERVSFPIGLRVQINSLSARLWRAWWQRSAATVVCGALFLTVHLIVQCNAWKQKRLPLFGFTKT